MMPLAGRLADLWGTRRLFLGALACSSSGRPGRRRRRAWTSSSPRASSRRSAAARSSRSGRPPPRTCSAAHARPRALGVIGALTFLGMAAGPFLGAAILARFPPGDLAAPADRLAASRSSPRPGGGSSIVNVPIGLVALVSAGRPRPAGRRHGARAGSTCRVRPCSGSPCAGLVALTLLGATTSPAWARPGDADRSCWRRSPSSPPPWRSSARCGRADPFLDVRLFRRLPFTSATLVSLLTGYAFATAIIGGAVFVDRVLYGGPDEQRLALGALAGATAVGALVSGLLVRVSASGSSPSSGSRLSRRRALAMARWTPATTIGAVAAALATLRPRVRPDGDAALDARPSRRRVRRRSGPLVDRDRGPDDRHGGRPGHPDRVRLHDDRSPVGPGLRHAGRRTRRSSPSLRDRPLRDRLVVEALESWASREAASIMVGLFLVAAVVTLVAIPPALALGGASATATDPTARGRAYAARRWHRRRPRPHSTTHRRSGSRPRRRATAVRGPGRINVGLVMDARLEDAETTRPRRCPRSSAPRRCARAIWVDLARPRPARSRRSAAISGSIR